MTKMEKFQEAYHTLILSLISQIKFISCCSSEISKVFLFLILHIIIITQYTMGIGIKNSFSFLRNTLRFTKMHFFVSKLILFWRKHVILLKRILTTLIFFKKYLFCIIFLLKTEPSLNSNIQILRANGCVPPIRISFLIARIVK